MLLVSFYTNDIYYEYHAGRLKKQCDKLGIDHDIRPYNPPGDWFAVTRAKPAFIKAILEETQKDILWLDVDCEILGIPSPTKFAVRMKDRIRPHAYVLYFPYNKTSFDIIDLWETALDELGDHDALIKIFSKLDHEKLPDMFRLKESGNYQKTAHYKKQINKYRKD